MLATAVGAAWLPQGLPGRTTGPDAAAMRRLPQPIAVAEMLPPTSTSGEPPRGAVDAKTMGIKILIPPSRYATITVIRIPNKKNNVDRIPRP